ncbi:unnamed protein product [Ascophyllum nodosum]
MYVYAIGRIGQVNKYCTVCHRSIVPVVRSKKQTQHTITLYAHSSFEAYEYDVRLVKLLIVCPHRRKFLAKQGHEWIPDILCQSHSAPQKRRTSWEILDSLHLG